MTSYTNANSAETDSKQQIGNPYGLVLPVAGTPFNANAYGAKNACGRGRGGFTNRKAMVTLVVALKLLPVVVVLVVMVVMVVKLLLPVVVVKMGTGKA